MGTTKKSEPKLGAFGLLFVAIIVMVCLVGIALGVKTSADVTPSPSPTLTPSRQETTDETATYLYLGALTETAKDEGDTDSLNDLAAGLIDGIDLGSIATDQYGLVTTALYQIAEATAARAETGYGADETGNYPDPDMDLAMAETAFSYADKLAAKVDLDLTDSSAWAGYLVGHAQAANRSQGSVRATAARRTASNQLAKSRGARNQTNSAYVLKLQPVERDASQTDTPTSAMVDVIRPGKMMRYSLGQTTTIPAVSGAQYTFSAYRLKPFALFVGGGMPPVSAWAKADNSGHAAVTIPVQTVVRWEGSPAQLAIPLLDKNAQKGGFLQRVGRAVGDIATTQAKKLTGNAKKKEAAKNVVVIIANKTGAPAEIAKAINNEIDNEFENQPGATEVASKPFSSYNGDDVVAAIAAQPVMVNGQMTIKLTAYDGPKQAKDAASYDPDYGGSNIGAIEFGSTEIALTNVTLERAADGKEAFIFKMPANTYASLRITAHKHDKNDTINKKDIGKTDTTPQQMFCPANGKNCRQTERVKVGVKIKVERQTGQASVQFAYQLEPFSSANSYYYPASAYPVPSDWTAFRVVSPLVDAGTLVSGPSAGTGAGSGNWQNW